MAEGVVNEMVELTTSYFNLRLIIQLSLHCILLHYGGLGFHTLDRGLRGFSIDVLLVTS